MQGRPRGGWGAGQATWRLGCRAGHVEAGVQGTGFRPRGGWAPACHPPSPLPARHPPSPSPACRPPSPSPACPLLLGPAPSSLASAADPAPLPCCQVYTTKRMQRVFSVRFSGDATYVFSGSDDMNVRVWKVRGQAGHQQCTSRHHRRHYASSSSSSFISGLVLPCKHP